MRQKILNQTAMLLLSSILITFLVVSIAMYDEFSGYMTASVREEAEYIRIALEETNDEKLAVKMGEFAGSSRITLLDAEGTVLYDSLEDESKMKNHSDRPEFADAVKNGSGEKIRYSDTLSEQTFYYAVRLRDGRVLRLAQSIDSVLGFLGSSITLIGILVFVIILAAFFVIWKQTAKWIEPINTLDLEHPLRHVAYEELRPLLCRVHEQKKQISCQMQELKERHEEYLAITENMQDGLIITNQKQVLSINQAAKRLFQVHASDCIQKPISRVSRNPQLKKALDQALHGKHDERIVEIHGRSYQLLANPVSVSDGSYGAVILIWDITEKSESEQMRREFSANVSHELKTPLMSISGYAELIEHGMVRQEDISEFAGRIHQEAQRLTALVNDFIQLSRLEEERQELPVAKVNLYEITREISERLEERAKAKNIQISIEGEKAEINGVHQILYEMFYNLVDNGIKYNRENGRVDIRIFSTDQKIFWQVQDNGIGIEKEHLDRIYERFYRVDKSHSRQTGGTGLGLSIAKHGAAVHKAILHTESAPGEGTKITVEFLKSDL